jgi:hypothetical protein
MKLSGCFFIVNVKSVSRRLKINFIVIQGYTVLCLLFGTSSLLAQTDTLPVVSIEANVDLVSRYIWRGQEYGHAPSIQPGLSVTAKDFTLGAWGAYKLTGAGDQETDFYLSKDIGPVNIALWDYWSFNDTSAMNFFNYNRKTTSHLLEAQVLLSGGETLPFNLLGSYFFYGTDASRSIYFELQYLHPLGQTDIVFFAGFQAKGDYYAPRATFVNIGCTVEPVLIADRFKLPIGLSLIVNPDRKSVYLVAGIYL